MNIEHRGKIVGRVEEDVYIAFKKPNHFFKKYGGFGISVEVLNRLKNMGIKKVRIVYEGVKGIKVYEQELQQYLESELVYNYHNEDMQKFVSIRTEKPKKEKSYKGNTLLKL